MKKLSDSSRLIEGLRVWANKQISKQTNKEKKLLVSKEWNL
jgi:hypothetical protein